MDNNELEDAIYRKPLSETQTLDAGNGLIPAPWIGNDKEPNGKPVQVLVNGTSVHQRRQRHISRFRG